MKTLYYIFLGLLFLFLGACGSKKSSMSKRQIHTEQHDEAHQLHFIAIRFTDSILKHTAHQLEQVQVWNLQGHVTISPEGLKTDRAIVKSWSQQTSATHSAELQHLEENRVDSIKSTTSRKQSLHTKDRKTHRKSSVWPFLLLLGIAIGGYVYYKRRR